MKTRTETVRICRARGCSKRAAVNGQCPMHYQRQRRAKIKERKKSP